MPVAKPSVPPPAPAAKPAPAAAPATKPTAPVSQPAATAAAPAAKPIGPTIDFTCAYCDEKVKVGLEMEGKQTPCPACKRIIKVPMQVKQAPKDWRTIDTRPGGLLRKDVAAAPKDAWGTETTVRSVSQSALEEAGALPEDLEPLPLGQRLKWPLVGVAAVAVLVLLVMQVRTYFAGGDRNKALALALESVYPPEGKEPLKADAGAAVVHRALGEFYGHWGRADQDAKLTGQAFADLRSARDAAANLPRTEAEREGQLLDTALTLVDLGGKDQQVRQGSAILWDGVVEEIRKAVAAQQAPEARAETLRQLTQKLLGKTDFDLSGALTSALPTEEAKPEAVAVVGLELWRLNQPTEAEAAAVRAQRIWEIEAARAQTAQQPPPSAPSLVALWLVLKKPERTEALKGGEDAEGSYMYMLGSVESQARLGQLDKLRPWIKSQSGLDQARFLALACALSLEQDPATAKTDLDSLVTLVNGPLKNQLPNLSPAAKAPLSWQLWRVVRLAARGGHEEQAQALAKEIPDLAVKGRAQLEILRARMERGNAVIDEAALHEVEPKSPAHRAARQEFARYKARNEGWTAKNIDQWEADWRPFGYAGVALGIQDKSR